MSKINELKTWYHSADHEGYLAKIARSIIDAHAASQASILRLEEAASDILNATGSVIEPLTDRQRGKSRILISRAILAALLRSPGETITIRKLHRSVQRLVSSADDLKFELSVMEARGWIIMKEEIKQGGSSIIVSKTKIPWI